MTEITWPSYSDDDGTYTTGTEVDAAFLDSIETEINALVHSSSNPTVTPADIIDEVVSARGSLASVDARLDVEHNEDGTHNLPATVATTAVLANSLHGINLCADPLMYCWPAGDAAAPAHYSISGTGAAIDRAGTGQSTTTRLYGDYAAELTYGSADAHLSQDLWASGDHAALDGFEGEILSFSVWTYTSTVNKVRAYVNDGNTETLSSYNTGGSSWQRLEVNHTISASATQLTVGVQIEGAGDVVISGFCAVFSDTNPDRFIPSLPVLGTVAFRFDGALVDGDWQRTWVGARPALIKDVQVHAQTPGSSGGIDFDIEVGAGDDLSITTDADPSDLLITDNEDGTWSVQVLDYAQLDTDNAVVTVTVNGVATTLTEDTDWQSVTDDDTAASNLEAAIEAVTGVTSSVSTDTVTVQLDAGTWNSIFSAAKTVDANDEFGNFTPDTTTYRYKCLDALHLDNGDHGAAGAANAVLRINIDDADSAEDVTFFIRMIQWPRPLEDALAYNTLG